MIRSRSNGLDTLRALAVVLVFMYHYMVFVSGVPTFGWASSVGWIGVDLFFVLSGYLIGNQIFAGLTQGRQLSPASFYARRALRTWPAFWVVLAAYLAFPQAMGGKPPPPPWKFLTFTQNYALQPGTAFSHAWSLCVEEQFYLVLPLVVLAALRFASRRQQGWMLLAVLALVGIVARGVLWTQYGREDMGGIAGYYPNIYYATPCRFDEFLPGIAVAMIRNFHPRLWQHMMDRGAALFVAGVAAVLLAAGAVYRCYYIDGYGYSFGMTAFGYPALAAAFALLVASALSERSPLQRVRIPGAGRIALWSYSIYLTHKPIGYIVDGYAKQYGFGPGLELVLVTATSIAIGALLYRLIERPFMEFRDRKFPHLFRRTPSTAPAAVRAQSTRGPDLLAVPTQ